VRIEKSNPRIGNGDQRVKVHLLAFDDGSDPDIDLRRFVDTLDDGAEMYTLDGHVCFLRSDLSVSELSDKFVPFAGSSLFLITELGSNYAGRMVGAFWDFIKQEKSLAAAE
jgi:hypothetical protein